MIDNEVEKIENARVVKDTSILGDDLTPDQAVKNIENSKMMNMTPDEYSTVASELDADIELQRRVPAQLNTEVSQFLTEDSQQAVAAKGNEGILDSIANRIKYFGAKSYDMTNNNREIVDLRLKQADGGLTEDEQDYLEELNDQNAAIIASKPEDVGTGGELFSDVLGGIYDLARGYTDNPEIVAGSTAAGAGLGAAAGTFVVPVLGTAAGAIKGATLGATVGASTLVGAVDGYRQTKGLTINSLMTSDKDITLERATRVSEAVGILSGVTGGLLGFIGGKTNPLLKRITNPAELVKIIAKNPRTLARLETLGSIATGILSEGTEEGLQGYIQKVGEKFALGGSDDDDIDAVLDNLGESLQMSPEELKEIGYEATVGGLTGAAVRAPVALASQKGLTAEYANQKKLAEERTVTLEFQETIQKMNEDFQAAEAKGFAKAAKEKFIDKTFAAMGMDRTLFMDAEALKDFADTPEKQEALDTLIATQEFNALARETGQDYQVTVNDLFKSGILDQFPEITEDITPNAKGETPRQLKANIEQFVKEQDEKALKRQELLAKHSGETVDRERLSSLESELLTFDDELQQKRNEKSLENNQNLNDVINSIIENPESIDGEIDSIVTSLFADVQDDLDNEGKLSNGQNLKDVLSELSSEISVLKFNRDQLNNPEADMQSVENQIEQSIENIKSLKVEEVSQRTREDVQLEIDNIKNSPEFAIEAELEALNTPVRDPQPFDSELDYLDHETFFEIPGVLTQAEADQLNQKDMLEVKMNVAQTIKNEVDRDFNQLARQATAQELKDQIKYYENNLNVLDSFDQKTTGKQTRFKDNSEAARQITARHKKKGYSPSAIDPKSLSEAQKEIYLNNPEVMKVLNKRKVFVEGGIHVEESALMNGIDSGDKLLDMLVDTPTRGQIKKLKIQQKIAVENEVNQLTKPLREDALKVKFNNMSEIYKRQLDQFRGKSWNILKKGIIKIAKPAVNVKDVRIKAKDLVSKMTIRNIQPNAFLKAERRHKRMSAEALTKGDPRTAYLHLEKAHLMHEMKAEATRVQSQVKKNQDFWKKVQSNKVIQATLNKSGHLDAMTDLNKLLNLNGKDLTNAEQAELASFTKFVKDQYSKGNYNIVIPERLRVTSSSIKDITYEQYDSITQSGKNILAISRKYNKVDKKVNSRITALSKDEMREQVREQVESHPDYNPERADADYESNMGAVRRGIQKGSGILNHVANINWISRELDAEQKDGFFYNNTTWTLELAKQAKTERTVELVNDLKGVVEKYFGNEKQFLEETSKFVTVPELAGFEGIADKDGNIRISELMVIQAYRGDGNYYQDIANYRNREGRKLSVEEMEAILETHLDEKLAGFVQEYLVNPFSKNAQDVVDLEKRFNGTDLELVEGRSFVHRGRVYQGGYYPGQRTPLTAEQRAVIAQQRTEANLPTLPGEEDAFDYSARRALERTKQSHVKQRTGSDRPMVLDMSNVFKFHEQILHDLTFREPGKEVLDFVTDDVNAKLMKGVIGKGKYETFLSSIQDVVSKTSEKPANDTTARVQKLISDTFAKFNSLHAIARIGLSASSILTQGASLITAAHSLGYMRSAIPLAKGSIKAVAGTASELSKLAINSPTGKKLLHHRISQALNDVVTFDKYTQLAKELNNDIQTEQDGIDDNVVTSLTSDLVNASDTKSEMKRKMDNINRSINTMAFAGLQQADNTIRSAVTLTIADMFYSGNYKGISIEDVNAMTEAEQIAKLKKIIQIETRSTLTASSKLDKTLLEKSQFGKQIVRYWTDQRNVLNLMLSEGRNVRNQWKDKNYRHMVNSLATMQVSAMLMDAYLNSVNPFEDDEEEDIFDTIVHHGTAIPRLVGSTTPLVSMAMWAADKSPWTRPSIPAFDIANKIIKGAIAMPDMFLADETVSNKELDNIVHSTMSLVRLPGAKVVSKALRTMDKEPTIEGLETDISPNSILDNGIEMAADMLNYFISTLGPEYDGAKEVMKEDLGILPQDPDSAVGLIDVDTMDTMAFALSDANWRKVDPETGAAGIYQFTEERWNEIMESEPELGLTESGRIEKDPSEQERAMNYSLRENAAQLNNYGFDVNDVNLLGAHIFGIDNIIAILEAEDDAKLSDILGDEANNPIFKNFSTVKGVKSYLSSQVN